MIDPAPWLFWRPRLSLLWMGALLIWETREPCFAFFKDGTERGLHGLRNLALALINVLAVSLGFVSAWAGIAAWSESQRIGLLHWIPLWDWLHALMALLALDLWTYTWHRMSHRIPMLWRFHQVHHSDPAMDVTTANRFHFGEIALSSLLRIPVIALVGVRFGELVVYETLLQAVVQFQHANIALPVALEHSLRRWVVTPGMHKVHHSREQPETDSNYASLLSIWDHLFGSLRHREDLNAIQMGLKGQDAPAQQTLSALLREPLQ